MVVQAKICVQRVQYIIGNVALLVSTSVDTV